MNGIADFHSHILPGIDDGSISVEMSLEMLKMAAEQGIQEVVATPHFYAQRDYPQQFLQRRNEAESRLRSAMQQYPDLPKLSIGAEVHFFPGMGHSDLLTALTIGSKKCMLIEMPDVLWTEQNYRELEEIHSNFGIIPVIAHVDRYVSPFRSHGIPERLAELPVLIQANASFFLKPWTRAMAMKMLRRDQIHLLGSDCHNLTSRAPNLGPALVQIRKCLGDDALSRIQQYQEMI